MPIIILNIILAYSVSLLGIFVYRSHLISSLLCLEGIILSIFVLCSLLTINFHFSLSFIIPITLLVEWEEQWRLSQENACHSINTYGLDYIQNLNALQC
uniref:NADH dehydrogenase subunit 4L n=1 Tax=Spermophilus dauricus TaxID=99837 RepID=A0A8C9Q2T9_SPEDA